MSTWKTRLTPRMHPFPCSAFLACFGNTSDNVPFDQSSPADSHSTIYVQPLAKADGHESHPGGPEEILEEKLSSCTHSEKNGSTGNHAVAQLAPVPEDLPVFPADESDCNSVMFHTSIPRPSIIEMPKTKSLKLKFKLRYEEPSIMYLNDKVPMLAVAEEYECCYQSCFTNKFKLVTSITRFLILNPDMNSVSISHQLDDIIQPLDFQCDFLPHYGSWGHKESDMTDQQQIQEKKMINSIRGYKEVKKDDD
ncbi:uncharacterized protein LOC127538646 [Antechinus flavipes]|uniref:uncharacterized protein LOC127538646 n=1 Tax=Antechinus flavipes TaxID=38775 RepID=UPI002235B556|nr:uncharacterized protein LOC127538646 [Antechinus flavipes]